MPPGVLRSQCVVEQNDMSQSPLQRHHHYQTTKEHQEGYQEIAEFEAGAPGTYPT